MEDPAGAAERQVGIVRVDLPSEKGRAAELARPGQRQSQKLRSVKLQTVNPT